MIVDGASVRSTQLQQSSPSLAIFVSATAFFNFSRAAAGIFPCLEPRWITKRFPSYSKRPSSKTRRVYTGQTPKQGVVVTEIHGGSEPSAAKDCRLHPSPSAIPIASMIHLIINFVRPTPCRSAASPPHERFVDVTPISLRRDRPLQRLVRRQDNQSSQFLRPSRPDLRPTPRFHDLSHVGHHDYPSQARIAGLTSAASRKCADRRYQLARR